MATILVTGGAGFIGSHVVDRLLARGDTVAVIDDFNDYYSPEQKEQNLTSAKENGNFHLYRGDIADIAFVAKIFSAHRFDAVCHLAARAGVRASISDPGLYYRTNVIGTLALLEEARKHKVKQFVSASSSSVYGNLNKGPFSEEQRVDRPVSPYAATKKAGEELCYAYHHLHGLPVTCLRFFTVYGPRGRPDMAPFIFTRAILDGTPLPLFGDGSAQRDFTFVDDIVSGVVSALDRPLGYEIINLGNSTPVKVSDLITALEKVLGKKAQIRHLPKQPGDVELTFADISKASRLLGYRPSTSLEQGLARFAAWYKARA